MSDAERGRMDDVWPVPIGGSAGGLRSVELNSTAERYAVVWFKGHAGMVDAVERPVRWIEACCRFDISGRGWADFGRPFYADMP